MTVSTHRALVERSGNLIRVTPAYKAVLAQRLYYDRRDQQGPGRKAVITPVYLFQEENGSLVVPAGLTRRVVQALRECNIEVVYNDLRSSTLGEPVYENLDLLRELQPDVITTLVVNDMCQIEAPTGLGKSFLIRQIPKLWPLARIIITSPFSGIIRQTYAELKEVFPQSVGMIGDGKYEPGRRITCALTQSLAKCDLPNADIIIFDEVHRAAAPATAENLAVAQKARMYGFSANATGRSDKADLETEAMFGPPLIRISYQEGQATGNIAPMRVLVMPCETLPHVDCSDATLERWCLWRNDSRNNLVKEALDLVFAKYSNDLQVLITVAKVEHAVHLAQLLPDFALVYAQMDGDKRLRWERDGFLKPNVHPITSEVREQMREDFASGKLRRVIATGVWGTGMDFPGLDCVVRADAQSGEIASTQLSGRATRVKGQKTLRSPDGKEFGIVIEFNDAFNKTLNNRFKRRMAIYRKKGWTEEFLRPIPRYFTS